MSAARTRASCGQAVYGWDDDFPASHFQTQARRDKAIALFRARVDKPEPLDWIETHKLRTSPFFRGGANRKVIERIKETGTCSLPGQTLLCRQLVASRMSQTCVSSRIRH